ncbi:hypothetical protein INR49_031185, partial [Caranx melampygus]
VSDVKLGPNRAGAKLKASEEDSKLKVSEEDLKLKASEEDSKLKVSADDTELEPSSFTPELDTESTQELQVDHSWISCQPAESGAAQCFSQSRTFLISGCEVVTQPSVSHRFRCPGPGQFQCTSTGLVFVMAHGAELLYRTVQWHDSLLQSVGKMAAGPLFSIQCPEDAVRQLHLPHCETKDALLCDGLLSVAHITDDGMSFIKPLEITDTHVIVPVPHLSLFGLVWVQDLIWRLWNNMKPVCSQVQLFRQPQPQQMQSLNVFLLPNNVHLNEVKRMQDDCVFINMPSRCTLVTNKTYTVHCPQADFVQPEKDGFVLDYGPNYPPTFQIFLPSSTAFANVEVQEENQTAVWKCQVPLPGPGPEPTLSVSASTPSVSALTPSVSALTPSVSAATPNVSAAERLRSARTEFIRRVSEPVLHDLLNKLLDCEVFTDSEMESVVVIPNRADKAREVIDTVRKKGEAACSALIRVLCEVDPFLSTHLNLM